MTRYLIDTSVFVAAHQNFYAMDICPGFWDWLEVMKKADRIASIQRVLTELADQEDALKTWAFNRADWFLPDNDQMGE